MYFNLSVFLISYCVLGDEKQYLFHYEMYHINWCYKILPTLAMILHSDGGKV